MVKRIVKVTNLLLWPWVLLGIMCSGHDGYAQQIKWLRVTELQSPVNEIGAEYTGEFLSVMQLCPAACIFAACRRAISSIQKRWYY
jgi:hypothetical protein